MDYSGAIHHVTVRGNARKPIFRDDQDRHILYRRLAASVKSYGVRIYLYCLLDNHFHLVVQTPRANLTRFMQSVLTGYTVSFNLRHRQCGHLTQGRYGARVVAGDDYLNKLSRYVHLNPVHVSNWKDRPLPERTAALRQYRWSSYRAYAGLDKREEWVDYEPLLKMTGENMAQAEQAYARFVEAGLARTDEEFLIELMRSPRGIGDERFLKWVDERHAELMENRQHPDDVALRPDRANLTPEIVLKTVADILRIDPRDVKARRRAQPGKGLAAYMLEKYAGLTRRACAPWLGINSGAAVGYQIRQALKQMETNSGLRRHAAKIEKILEKKGE